jgi:predicted DCC family thiol-disulfide oxidoreductase YuxK
MEEDEKYLFIDSECPYCNVFGRILTNRGYKVFPVRSELGRKFSKQVLGRELLDMILYDRDEGKVYVGEDAAEAIVRNEAGSGTVVASLSYDYVEKL